MLNEQMTKSAVAWLLDDITPAVRYRTYTEILHEVADKQPVIEWLRKKLPDDWQEQTGLWRTYYLTAIAECGLSAGDFGVKKDTALLFHGRDGKTENGCDDFMRLRALVKLGLGHEPLVLQAINGAVNRLLPDGGFLCLHRLDKLKHVPKSCVKANMQALMLCAECKKQCITVPFADRLLEYFWNHRLFYHSDNPDMLMLNCREGWRTIDTFYPFEVMRVGLQNIVESISALGYGNDPRLQEAWDLLAAKQGADGKFSLDGTLSKSYLPKERVGKPSKWVTFYALLAQTERDTKLELP